MKKTKNFLLSIILPRRMVKYRNMHGILALFIYLIGMFLAIGSQFIMSENFVAKDMERTEYVESLKDNDGINFANMQVISFSDDKNITADEAKAPKITKRICAENFDNGTTSVKFVYDDTFTATTINENILLEYYKSIKDSTKTEIFYVFGKDEVCYVQNLDTTLDLPTEENTKVFVNDIFTKFSKINRFEQNGDTKVDKFAGALSYLQRLQRVDKVEFVNTMNELLEIAVVVKKVDNATDTSIKTFDEYTTTFFATQGIYHCVLKDKPEGFVDLMVVIDVNMDTDNDHKKFTYFDYEGYMKQERTDKTTYILCVYTSRRFFFVYDLCQKLVDGKFANLDYNGSSVFEKTKAGNYKYYLPKDPSEIKYNAYGELDTRYWTKEVNGDDVLNKDEFYGKTILTNKEVDEIKPADRHKENLEDAVYSTHSRSYQYRDLSTTGFEDSNTLLRKGLNNYLQIVCDAMISVDAANYELIYGIISFGIFVIFPLILVLIVWLMSKKLFMKKIREYYAIGAICYSETGLLAFIVGFFLPFDKFALYLMLVQAWYFIFVTFRINTDPQYNNDETNKDNPKPVEEKLEFKKIKESSNASKIG